jgi:hypothetical protein
MMATRATFTPFSAEFPASAFPELRMVNRRPVLAFDASADETVWWTFVAPQGLTTPLTVIITYMMASAITNAVGWQAAIEAVSDGDATDLDAVTSFDSQNSVSVSVPGTQGYIDQASITLTSNDAIAAGDYVRLAINRDANGSAVLDTATGDAYLLCVELRDSA